MDLETEQPEIELQAWAERLLEAVDRVMARHPEADRDNIRHTLILLEYPPIERLRRSLVRGRFAAQ
jgi:hypothetical protein